MHILVVDDDAAICDALKEHLEAGGHQVVTARDGQRALESLRTGFQASVIVLDLLMPGMDGWDFRSVQLSDPSLAKIPVVVLSGSGFTAATIRKQLGVADYLPKPPDPGRLEEVLVRLSETTV
jgi:CheY-like chemotaxis protein